MEFAFDTNYLKVLNSGKRQTEQVAPQFEAQDGAQDGAQDELSAIERLILATCEFQPRSTRELLVAAGYSQRTGNLKRAMERLLSLRLISYTLPNKPQSRHQKYKLTALGMQWLKR